MAGNDKRDPYADEVASAKALMSEKQYDEQPWGDWAGDAVGNALNTAKAILPTALGGRGEVGISDMARGAYEGAKDAVTFPGDVISGKQPLYDESGRPLESAVGRSFNTVGAVGGASSLVPVPDNSLRVFGGIKSKTADKNALTKAQISENSSPDRDAIWRQTGWGRGAEGSWRYEIPDVGTTVDPTKFQLDLSSATIPSGMKTTLSEYINHPELFDAYPEFKNMPVKGYYDPNSNVHGYYMPRYSSGTINPGFNDPYIALNLSQLPTVEAQRDTLLHEIQHAIQQKEGFVPGTNVASRPLQTANPLHAFYKKALKTEPELQELEALRATDAFKAEQSEKQALFAEFQNKIKELDAKEATTGVSTKQEYIDAVNNYMKETEGKFPLAIKAGRLGFELEDRGIPSSEPPEFLDQLGAYLADAGEVESRNVQNRRDGPREELKERPPWRTQDRGYPYEGQLIDWNNTSWRKGYAGRGRVAKGIADEVVDLAKRILGSEPEVRKVTGAELLKKTEGLSEDPFKFSKFSKPFNEMEYTVKMLPREEYKSLDPYDLVKQNATIVGHISDRTAAGREVSNIGGVDLTEPLTQRGGVDYQRTTPHAWANRPGAAQTLYQKVNEPAGYEWDKKAKQFVKTGEQEGPVYTTPIFMGAPSANSSHMVGVPFLRMVPNMPISKADKLAFDAMMSERFPGWPGIENTKAAEDFLYHGNLPKNAPTAFTKYASAKKWKLGAGFPDIEEIMFSAMDPRLVGVDQGTTGMGFKEIEPNKKIIVKGEDYHPDYPASIPGKEYAGGFKYQTPQGLVFPEWWGNLKPELRLPENATGAQYAAMTQLPTQKATPEWADKISQYWEENPIPWGYADGGEVDDDIYHAVRLARDVGGATNENPQVMMTDANGVQYDATGKVIPAATPQANSNSAAAPSPTTPEEVGRRAAEDPATFDAMMERYAVPDRDIVDYEALKKEVSQQPQQVQQMTHIGAPPMRDIKVDMPLFGGEYSAGQAPYDIANPMSGVAQTAYDLKTVPLYFTPMTAPIGAGMDVAEGVATGDPLTASLAIGFGPGGKMAKAAGIGAANYFIDPSDAEAGKASIVEGALKKILGSGDDAVKSGIRAYHGTPHNFPPVRLIEMPDGTRLYQNMLENTDTPEGAKILQEYPLGRFDISKIGTGEGAQAYGHGLYFAENEGVAKGYRDALTDPQQVKIRINDKHIPSVWVEDLRRTFPEMYKGLSEADQDVMDSLLGTMESAYSVQDAANAAESVGGRAKLLFNQRVKPFVTKPEVNKGSIYEISINADPNAFLDWDKPLSEQPGFLKSLTNYDPDYNVDYEERLGKVFQSLQPVSEPLGHDFYAELARSGKKSAASMLKDLGVPGIKYLDAGSRQPITVTDIERAENDLKQVKTRRYLKPHEVPQAEVDKAQANLDYIKSQFEKPQSRNYVVFDDKLISIIRKYGIAGASAMLGYNLMERLDPKQALAASMADEDYQESSGSRMQGGRVTEGNAHDNDDPAVSRAIALTREY